MAWLRDVIVPLHPPFAMVRLGPIGAMPTLAQLMALHHDLRDWLLWVESPLTPW